MKMKFFPIICLIGIALSAQTSKIEIEQPVYLEQDSISGTLVTEYPLDSRKIKHQTLLIIIPGSGPTDRNGNSTMLQGINNSYQLLADSLFREGLASYRYDKLGIGASSTDIQEEDMLFSSNVEVVEAIVRKMREIGFRKIFLLGHSEGSLIAMMAANKVDVQGIISIAGAGRDFSSILDEQLKGKISEELHAETMRKLDSIKAGHLVETYNPMLYSLLRESIQPYLQEMLNLNPVEQLARVEVPVLIVQGGADLQVRTSDAEALKEAKPNAAYLFYPEMNHVLKLVKSELENQASYRDADFPLQPKLVEDIRLWIQALN